MGQQVPSGSSRWVGGREPWVLGREQGTGAGGRGESLEEGRTDGESPGRAEVRRAFRGLARAENLCWAKEGDDAEI